MGLFFNFDKPGRGISEEEAKKRNFFGILGRKFTGIFKISLLYFFVNIILFAALAFFIAPLFFSAGAIPDEFMDHLNLIITAKRIMSPLPFIVLALFGPTTAGLTYVTRNFAKQEPVFIASDFFEHTKKNFGQSLAAGFIMSAVLYFYTTALLYYMNNGHIAIVVITMSFGLTLLLASFYVFPLIVTFRMPLFKILRNSLILGILNLPQNLLALAALAALHILLIFRAPIIWVFLMPLFLIGFSSYTVNFVAWNIISKNIEKSEQNEGGEEQ